MIKKSKYRIAFAAVMAAAFICVMAVNAAPQTQTSALAPAKPMKFRGTIVTANGAAIVIRNPANPRDQRSFSYSPAVRQQMVKILGAGGFQYGDKVTVEYATGTTVALKLEGKPSKPKTPRAPPQSSPLSQ